MTHQSMDAKIEEILSNSQLSATEQIGLLEEMRECIRAQQRAATESSMAGDDDVGADLKKLDEILDRLNANHTSIEDSGAATL